MPLPTTFNTGTVTGTYTTLLGDPAVGAVVFTVDATRLVDHTDLTVIIPERRVVPLEPDGTFTVELPATNDPDINPTGFTYTVVEKFSGRNARQGQSYSIAVPVGTVTDISTVVAVDATTGIVSIVGPTGAAGAAGAAGLMAAATSAETATGTSTALAVTPAGLKSVLFPATTVITYNPGGSVATVTENGVLTSYTYNADGSVHTDTRGGVTRTYTYDGSGNLTGIAV